MRIFSLRAFVAVSACTATLLLGGCKVSKDEDGAQPPVAAAPSTPVPTAPSTASVAGTGFDINTVPLSSVPLGAFPYFTLPTGYVPTSHDSGTLDYARFPFWVNGANHWVEGKMYQAGIEASPGKTFSPFELVKNFDNALIALGGKKLTEAEIPGEFRNAWPEEVKKVFYYPHYMAIGNDVHVWVIHRKDGNIWVYLASQDSKGGYVIAREGSMEQTSQLLPAASLKQAIDTTGKVALQVNFATDKTDILPDSLPQIDEVVQLMKDDPALKLAIGGHTDATGDKMHNQTLSEGRAKSVVATLIGKGIDPARLTAKGYGDSRPVAANASEDGKAKNRRVELVKI